jgi:hypothetical protein
VVGVLSGDRPRALLAIRCRTTVSCLSSPRGGEGHEPLTRTFLPTNSR